MSLSFPFCSEAGMSLQALVIINKKQIVCFDDMQTVSLIVSTTWHSNDDDVYRAPPIDRSILPTAPRAAREPNIDRSRLPRSPPYTAFLGNLPYDVSEESIKDFFRGLNVSMVHPFKRSGF